MEAALNSLHLLRPLCLLALPVWLLLVYGLWRSRSRNNGWSTLCDPALLAYLVGDSSKGTSGSIWLPATWALGGTLLIMALAGPVWQQLAQPLYRAQSGMVIVLDLSRSMDAGDLKPSRLQRAKQKLQDILQARREGQTGLVVFAGSAFDVVPLTSDNKAILVLLPSLDTSMMPTQGSRASAGLKHASAMLKRGAIRHGSIVMLTDGVDTQALSVARQLAAAGDHLSILGVGTAHGAPIPLPGGGFLQDAHGNIVIPQLHEDQLSALAAAGDGVYQHTRADDLDIKSLPGLHPTHVQAETKSRMQSDQWREEGAWLVLLALLLLVLVFRRGALLLLLLIPLSIPTPADAMTWRNLWRTPDQQAQALMQQGDAKAAAKYFQNPAWKGAALYKAGQFDKAAKILKHVDTADGWYDRGNALAKAGHLKQAVAAYDQALRRNPTHTDAKFNRKLVQKLLKKKQQKQQKKSHKGKQNRKQSGDQDKNGKKSNHHKSGSQQKQGGTESGQKPGQEGQTNRSLSLARQPTEKSDTKEGKPAEKGKQSDQRVGTDKKAADMQSPVNARRETGAVGKDNSRHPAARAEASDEKNMEKTDARRQWLRRIPDDPGGLLRRKFKYQYQQQSNHAVEEQGW